MSGPPSFLIPDDTNFARAAGLLGLRGYAADGKYVGHRPASGIGASYDVAWPTKPGSKTTVRFDPSTNAIVFEEPSGGGGMDTAASNAASTAVGADWVAGTDNSKALGTATTRWTTVKLSDGCYVYAASADANPTAKVFGSRIDFGVGGGTAVDGSLVYASGKMTLTSKVADTGSNNGIVLNNTTTLTSGRSLVDIQNNATSKLTVLHSGSLQFAGTSGSYMQQGSSGAKILFLEGNGNEAFHFTSNGDNGGNGDMKIGRGGVWCPGGSNAGSCFSTKAADGGDYGKNGFCFDCTTFYDGDTFINKSATTGGNWKDIYDGTTVRQDDGTDIQTLGSRHPGVRDTIGSGSQAPYVLARAVMSASITAITDTTERTLIGTIQGSKTIAASRARVGSNFTGRAWFLLSTHVATPGTMQIRVKFGSTVILDTGAFTPPTNLSNQLCYIDYDITCRATGASGNVFAQGCLGITGLVGLNAEVPMPNTGTVTIDTTTSQVVDVMLTFGTNAVNSATGTNFTHEEKY